MVYNNIKLTIEGEKFVFVDEDENEYVATTEDDIYKFLSKNYELIKIGNKRYNVERFTKFFDVKSYVRREKLNKLINP